MTRLEKMILFSPPFRLAFRAADRFILPGTDGLSLFIVGKFFFKEIKHLKLSEKAAAVTYNFLMALPPTLLFLFSLVPYLPLKGVEPTILATLRMVLSNDHMYTSVSSVIVDFMHTQHKDLLSFGILLTVYYSSNGLMALMRSFDNSMKVYKKRSAFARRWTAIKLTLLLISVSIITLAALIIQSNDLNHLLLRIFGRVLAIKIFSLLIIVGIVFCAISMIYVYGPSLTAEFKFVSLGSVVATILSVSSTAIFFFLVNNFINYNKVYGSIGTLIVFMIWLWMNVFIVLLGYELNVSILLGKISRTEQLHETDK